MKPLHVALLVNHLGFLSGKGGGVERCQWRLAQEYANRGFRVDVVTLCGPSSRTAVTPHGIRVVPLDKGGMLLARLTTIRNDPLGILHLLRPLLLIGRPSGRLRYLAPLKNYLEAENPDLFISAGTYENLVVLLAHRASRTRTRVLVSERNTLSQVLVHRGHDRSWRWRHLPPLLSRYYAEARKVIAISRGVADDLRTVLKLDSNDINVIYNPVIDQDIAHRARQPVDHPWLTDHAIPVILSVGRFREQKDFPTLLKAFALAREQRPLRLVILGDGPERQVMEQLADELGISSDVDMPGFDRNPYGYMASASLLVLSSRYEGFGNVLVEALACGCQVVSTDCPSGPGEILERGHFGGLVPVGQPELMAEAVLRALDNPVSKEILRARSRAFTVERAADEYLKAAGFDTIDATDPATYQSATP